MIISDSRKLVFIHIHRTGGTSIREHLMSHISDVKSPYWHHAHFGTNPEELEALEGYWKFCFVRNPWERIYSYYKLYLHDSVNWERKTIQFEDFIDQLIKTPPKHFPSNPEFRFNQLDHLLDKCGDVKIDFIGRYENHSEDVRFVMSKIGIPSDNFPHVNHVIGPSYIEAYSEGAKSLIADLCAKDIEYFGYSFEQN